MRNARKHRKRYLRSLEVMHDLVKERKKCQATIAKSLVMKNMAETFWERWHHELEDRKELLKREREYNFYSNHPNQIIVPIVDRSLLSNPIEFGKMHIVIGIFSSDEDHLVYIVKCQMYRGICVSVKEFLPHTMKESAVKRSTDFLSPFLPYSSVFLLKISIHSYCTILRHWIKKYNNSQGIK